MLRAATAFAALAKSLVAGVDVPQMSPVANIVIKKDSGVGKLRFVKLSGISSGIADSNSLEIKVGESTTPAILQELRVDHVSGKLSAMLFFSVIPGSVGTAIVDLLLENTMSMESQKSFNISVLGASQFPTPSPAGVPGKLCSSTWGSWSECTSGFQSRVQNQSSCNPNIETRDCLDLVSCPEGDWSEWSACFCDSIRTSSKHIVQDGKCQQVVKSQVCLADLQSCAHNPRSCAGHCGGLGASGCGCDLVCAEYEDCCPDYQRFCRKDRPAPTPELGCGGLCGTSVSSKDANHKECWCDEDCRGFDDCCEDYQRVCRSSEQDTHRIDTCFLRCGHRFVEAAPTFLQMNKAQLSFYSGYITIQHASLDQHAPPRGSIESLYPRLVAALLDEGYDESAIPSVNWETWGELLAATPGGFSFVGEGDQPEAANFGFTQETFSQLDALTVDMDQTHATAFKRQFVETVVAVTSSQPNEEAHTTLPHCQCDEGCFSRGDCCWDIFLHCSISSMSFNHVLVNAPRCHNKCSSVYRQEGLRIRSLWPGFSISNPHSGPEGWSLASNLQKNAVDLFHYQVQSSLFASRIPAQARNRDFGVFPSSTCWCDDECTRNADCCSDFELSCK